MKKYIGMDVHKATTVIAVIGESGKRITDGVVETSPEAILDFINGQRGALHVTLEECAQAAWLYDMLRPYVADVLVCDPRKIAKASNKADKSDAARLAELLRTNALTRVYHGEQSTLGLKELAQGYACLIEDRTRVKNRLKALFRARGIPCEGAGVYGLEEREEWLAKLDSAAVRVRAGRLCNQLDCADWLSIEAEQELTAEARKHPATKILRSIPGIGYVRAAVIIGVAGTPHRFRTKRQFWSYCGLGVRTEASSEYKMLAGKVVRSNRRPLVRGLNQNYSRALKSVFKSAARTVASGPWRSYFEAMIENGTPESLAYLTLARKIASVTLALWKRGERYSQKKLKIPHAA